MAAHPSADADVLVVGGGPAGAAVAIPLAKAGHRVLIVDRDDTSPQGSVLLSPRAVTALDRLGIADEQFHRVDGVRISAGEHSSTTSWPDHDEYSSFARVADRGQLAAALLEVAQAAGARLLLKHEAASPIVDRGFVRGAHVSAQDGADFEARATYTIIADGANSRFGRALGTFREPSWPHALAHAGTFRSALHAAPEIEMVANLVDRFGTPVTGYGWMFPGGNGTVTIGVMIMSTSPSFRVINPVHMFDRFAKEHADDWHLTGDPIGTTFGGRIPMGLSVGPSAGATYLIVGDAVGAPNPLSGSGVEAAFESGLVAADVIGDALDTGDASVLQRYPQLLGDQYGSYFKIGRLTDRILGQPTLSTTVGSWAARNRVFTDAVLRVMTGEFRSGHLGLPEMAFRLARAGSLIAPDA